MAEDTKPAPLSLETLLARIEAQDNAILEQKKINAQLLGRLAQTEISTKPAEKLVIPKEPVKGADGKEYLFQVAGFTLHAPHGFVKATEAAISPEVIAAILKIEGQGILKEKV